MSDTVILPLMQGALVLASGLAGLFFLQFWSATRDRLFLFFAMAFWVLSGHWLALAMLALPSEDVVYLYVPRLVAFILIIAGVLDKNRHV